MQSGNRRRLTTPWPASALEACPPNGIRCNPVSGWVVVVVAHYPLTTIHCPTSTPSPLVASVVVAMAIATLCGSYNACSGRFWTRSPYISLRFFFVYVSSSISFSVSFSFWALGFSLSSSFGIHDSKPVCRWLPANCRGTSFWPSSDMERPPSQDGARNLANVLKGHPRCRAASSATCCMPALGRLSRTQSSANLAVAELVTWPLGHLAELPS